jgi:hypothetical protein
MVDALEPEFRIGEHTLQLPDQDLLRVGDAVAGTETGKHQWQRRPAAALAFRLEGLRLRERIAHVGVGGEVEHHQGHLQHFLRNVPGPYTRLSSTTGRWPACCSARTAWLPM